MTKKVDELQRAISVLAEAIKREGPNLAQMELHTTQQALFRDHVVECEDLLRQLRSKIDRYSTVQNPPPPEWGKDRLTQFFDGMRNNAYGTFAHRRAVFEKLIKFDGDLDDIMSTYAYPSNAWTLPCALMRKAHTSFRTAAFDAVCGKQSEVRDVARTALEYVVCAVAIRLDPALESVWRNRMTSAVALRASRNAFAFTKLVKLHIRPANTALAVQLETIHQRTIDYGAHPNPEALQTVESTHVETKRRHIEVIAATSDPVLIVTTINELCEIGLLIMKTWGVALNHQKPKGVA